MDPAKQLAITSCGRCGRPEDEHKGRPEDAETLAVLGALGGACTQFVASDASVIYVKHLAIAGGREPQRRTDGRLGRRAPLCGRCGQRGHRREDCPL